MSRENAISRLSSYQKLLISIILGAAAYLLFPLEDKIVWLRIIFSWNIFCAIQIILYWITFYNMPHQSIRRQAQRQDDGIYLMFILILIASLVCMMAVIGLLTAKAGNDDVKTVRTIIAISCMLLSWFLVHTIFSVRYAHIYYADSKEDKSKHFGGLDFPGQDFPDFIDFAYFSFTLGMTFQVSDVSVTSVKMRRLVLWHCLISFGFNVIIIALTINTISSISQ